MSTKPKGKRSGIRKVHTAPRAKVPAPVKARAKVVKAPAKAPAKVVAGKAGKVVKAGVVKAGVVKAGRVPPARKTPAKEARGGTVDRSRPPSKRARKPALTTARIARKPAPAVVTAAKRPRGRPEYEPSDRDRVTVKVMTAGGMEQAVVAGVLGISEHTLRKHFRYELDHGAAEMNGRVIGSLYNQAVSRGNVTAAIWLTKIRLKWSEKITVEGEGDFGLGKIVEILEARRRRPGEGLAALARPDGPREPGAPPGPVGGPVVGPVG